MGEKIIDLGGINPLDIYGTNNKTLTFILDFFPKVKCVARGNTLKLIGDDESIEEFEKKFSLMLEHFIKYQRLTHSNIERIILEDSAVLLGDNDTLVHGPHGKIIKARTANQRKMVKESQKNDMVFAVGPAGTGKTYTAVAIAVRALKNKEVKRIVLSRPAVEAGENLGFLPGDLKEKLDPYLQPLYDALRDMIPSEKLNEYIEYRIIEIAPLAFMRGRTLDNAFVILDEAQNSTHQQMKMFLTRMGKSAKFIITGDETQIDLPAKQPSGLLEALKVIKNIKGISVIKLDDKDVIRHELVKKIIKAYKSNQDKNE
ncbi:MAG: PhoH family protein [Flavobacteriales bacterium]|jgi:phosphate starvation-inducible PhoH-like protein|nr:PhoH family protein [Flavobacteriales bacterium]|tara:strand:+ start:104 stop:1048 length:945 start_codon:yes stop_codon:yes gene_type:complete